MRDGLPSRASMNLATTPVPILAVYTPNAMSVRPAACCVCVWRVQACNKLPKTQNLIMYRLGMVGNFNQ